MQLINSDIDFFLKELEGKRVVCVGAGQMLDDMFLLWNKDITSKIDIIFDNKKDGVYRTTYGKEIPIRNVLDILQIDINKYVILVTTMYCKSIYEQLNSLLGNREIKCFLYPVMSLHTSEFEITKRNTKQKIPKIIHYCWFGKGEMPEENQRCIDSWKKFCPDYEIVKWTEDNYDVNKCLYMKQAYAQKKWGFVPDYARLDIISEYGGIYFDTDVEIVKSFDDLLYEDAFIGFQRNYWVDLGLGFGAMKNNSIIKEMMNDYEKEEFEVNGKLNQIASPYYQTKCLLRHGLKCNNKYQYVDNITILPTEVLDSQGFSFGKITLTKNSYSIHHYSESWVDEEKRKFNLEKYQQINYFR